MVRILSSAKICRNQLIDDEGIAKQCWHSFLGILYYSMPIVHFARKQRDSAAVRQQMFCYLLKVAVVMSVNIRHKLHIQELKVY